MTHEEQKMRLLRHERIARVKRLLRLMPRKATMHKFPVLKWFTKAARKRSYLWCFRVKTVVPAIYAGCILSLLPIYGIQLPLAVALSFLLRANLPILASLQFITNPLTALPAYFTAYQIGRIIMLPFGIDSPSLNMDEMKILMDSIRAGNWGYNFNYIGTVWLFTALGGIVLGTFLGTIGSVFYRMAAYEVVVFNDKLRALQKKIRESHAKEDLDQNKTPLHSNDSSQ
jgi:uncharacterized protein (DUF2062 family)